MGCPGVPGHTTEPPCQPPARPPRAAAPSLVPEEPPRPSGVSCGSPGGVENPRPAAGPRLGCGCTSPAGGQRAHCFLLPFDVSRGGVGTPLVSGARSLGCAWLRPVSASGAWVCWGQAGARRAGWGRRPGGKTPAWAGSTRGGEGGVCPEPTEGGGRLHSRGALLPGLSGWEGGAMQGLCLKEETEASGQSQRATHRASYGDLPRSGELLKLSVAAALGQLSGQTSPTHRTPGLASGSPGASQGSG